MKEARKAKRANSETLYLGLCAVSFFCSDVLRSTLGETCPPFCDFGVGIAFQRKYYGDNGCDSPSSVRGSKEQGKS
jgi:hypothetical protein